MSGTYVVVYPATAVSTAISIIQIKAGAGGPLEILRAHVSQGLSETSTMEQINIVRKSAAATVTSATPLKFNPADQASLAVGGTAATGTQASAEGTDSDILISEGFNILNGWTWLPTPEERIFVPGGGIIALKFPVAPASFTVRAYIVFREIG